MERGSYTADELRLARRMLEDIELGRWPRRGDGLPRWNEPEQIRVVFLAGECLRQIEGAMRVQVPRLVSDEQSEEAEASAA